MDKRILKAISHGLRTNGAENTAQTWPEYADHVFGIAELFPKADHLARRAAIYRRHKRHDNDVPHPFLLKTTAPRHLYMQWFARMDVRRNMIQEMQHG